MARMKVERTTPSASHLSAGRSVTRFRNNSVNDSIKTLSALRCSVCGDVLHFETSCVKCANGHSFDLSRDGYVNLLLSKKGVPKGMGDLREMLKARRSFLEKGYFDCFYDELIHRTKKHLSTQKRKQAKVLNVLDIGCGEGYYLGRLVNTPPPRRSEIVTYGIDLSKDGVRLASKKHKHSRFLLADVHHEVPFLDRSVSVLSSIFSPRRFDEFARIMEPGGLCLIVIPTPEHLKELRQFVDITKVDEDKELKLLNQSDEFEYVEGTPVSYTKELAEPDLRDLLTMTPNFRHNPDFASLSSIKTKLSVTFSVKVLEFKRS